MNDSSAAWCLSSLVLAFIFDKCLPASPDDEGQKIVVAIEPNLRENSDHDHRDHCCQTHVRR